MSDHHKKHSNKHEHTHRSKPKGNAKNLWFVVAVVLMLAGMVIYVLTNEEEEIPDADKQGQQVPVDAPAE